ncbi:hypothetical protein MLD38_033429 [Melastoma candidum]|uniref:Uncharacterized protein n=1 Tax=Melastoma candidum TaxID=119954 RepID=A0ACB9M768_9MYRT|nr:hypothetical protein MLD38_033429 [Melastoma candidum]
MRPKTHLPAGVIGVYFLLSCLIFPCSSLPRSSEQSQAFTSILVHQKGLDFVKDLLVNKAVSSSLPIRLPTIEKYQKIPFVGNVRMVLSEITIYKLDAPDSYIRPGDAGVAIIASGTTGDISMRWNYSYSTWLLPVEITDKGSARVKVKGMEVGITVGLETREGSLKLTLLDGGCHVHDLSIELDGGASWLYQGMVDAFDKKIRSLIESAITSKLKEGISKLDLLLRSIPKEVYIGSGVSLNVTIVNDPQLSSSSIGFQVNGLFMSRIGVPVPDYYVRKPYLAVSCRDPAKMLGISLDEAVFLSASSLYYNANFMHWIVDKIPDQSLLNTAGWRFIIPQLYKQYPDDAMNLNISLSSPPDVHISENNFGASVYADFVINVIEAGKSIPVACISLVIRGSGTIKVVGNNLAGSLKLSDFTMSLKWSNIGNLRLFLIQPVMWTIIETVFLPYANSHLGKGFPLPIIHGFTLRNAEVTCSDSQLTVCSDVSYSESTNLKRLMIPLFWPSNTYTA